MASSGFSCTHCGKAFNGPVPFFAHLQSDKHRKKAALTQVGSDLSCGDSTEMTPRAPPMRRKIWKPIICRVCNVPLNSKVSVEIHNKGKNHQRMLRNEDYRGQLVASGNAASSRAGTSSGRSEAARSAPSAPASEKQFTTVEPGVIDLSCERCGIVLFKSIEHKVEHLRICPRFSSQWWSVVQSSDDEEWDALLGLKKLTVTQNP
ncbi:uncharacterized protein [Dermacentor andersoni]|uniref:uncharacterized protein n=1 Tax=Dermacentor andersoni TaxID=34620 RepID=UPI003B3A33EC